MNDVLRIFLINYVNVTLTKIYLKLNWQNIIITTDIYIRNVSDSYKNYKNMYL